MAVTRTDRCVLAVLMRQAAEIVVVNSADDSESLSAKEIEKRVRWVALNAPQATYELEDGSIVRGLDIVEA